VLQQGRGAVLLRFGTRVQQLRLKRALSQGQLAAKLGVHRPFLSDIERGIRNPSLRTISKIAGALAVDLVSLFRSGRLVAALGGKRVTRTASYARLGRRVQELREGRGWSLAQLAGKVKLPRPYLRGIERGTHNPSLLRIARMANVFRVELVELFRPSREDTADLSKPIC
jgi:transcriptional regulator with XRE-family HTH domain